MKAIVAISDNWGIGNKGGLPWPKVSEDFRWFKKCTLNQRVIFGSITRKALPPLYDRVIFTLSSKHADQKNLPCGLGAVYVKTEKGNLMEHYASDIRQAGNDSWLCGGASIYKQFLHLCDELYVTHIKGAYTFDTAFPFSPVDLTKLFPYRYFITSFEGGHRVIKYSKK